MAGTRADETHAHGVERAHWIGDSGADAACWEQVTQLRTLGPGELEGAHPLHPVECFTLSCASVLALTGDAAARLTLRRLSYKMSYMGKASVSVRELQQNLKRVMARVERGEVVEVTRRSRPVARLAPVKPRGPVSGWPDLEERTRAVFGDRVIAPGGSDVVIEDRGDR
jgi:prevent-host-death family protein